MSELIVALFMGHPTAMWILFYALVVWMAAKAVDEVLALFWNYWHFPRAWVKKLWRRVF